MAERGEVVKLDISQIMRRIHSQNTSPEMIFATALRDLNIPIEVNRQDIPGKPDIVIESRNIAIFIDGDFWHGGQWKKRGKTSLEEQFLQTPTRDYWLRKIRRNMQRDTAITETLLSNGWIVLRFWESDIKKQLEGCVTTTRTIYENGATRTATSLLPQMTVAEFFAGIGLMRMGLEQSGWRVIFANDIDSQKQEMYYAQFPDAESHFRLGDVHLLQATEVPTVTLATASFPCNDLSLAGAREGLNGKESSAFWGFVRILNEMDARKPPIVLLENVPGLLNSHGGKDLREALRALNDLGYFVDTFFLDAINFVPQSRQRFFIIGLQKAVLDSKYVYNSDDVILNDLRPKKLIDFIKENDDVMWALRSLPNQPEKKSRLEDIIDDLPSQSPYWWSFERSQYLLNQMSPSHRARADQMIKGLEWSYGTVFRRMRHGKSMAELRTDGVAGCLRTPRGGSGRQILVKAGKDQFYARLLTPQECAKLMGADDYNILVPLNQALFGFGDAVCVPVINWIATYYLNPIVNELVHSHALFQEAPRKSNL